MRNAFLPSAAAVALAAGLLATSSLPAMACSADSAYLGSICMVGEDYCPNGFVPAQGQLLQINANQALYSLLGTTFGGDGRTSFALPDLRGRMPYGLGQATTIPNFPTVNPGQAVGQEQVQLTVANMPPHTHAATFAPIAGAGLTATTTFQAQGGYGTTNAPSAGNYLSGASGAKMWGNTASTPTQVQGLSATVSGSLSNPTGTNSNAGASAPVSLNPPQIGLTFCIATKGIYPQRP